MNLKSSIHRIAGTFLFSFVMALPALGLDLIEEEYPYHVNYITNDDGLPQNTVTEIFLDKFGFLWFGTGNGLARYDGYSFTVYNKKQLPSNLINALEGNTDNRLWVGTNKGLAFIDLTTGDVSPFDLREKSELPPIVNAIKTDENGNVWVGTAENGLFQLVKDSEGYELVHYNIVVGSELNPSINTLLIPESGVLLGGSEQGLFSIDTREGVSLDAEFLNNDWLRTQMDVRSLYRDTENRLWVGTFYGLMLYDISQQEGQWFYPDNADDNALVHGAVNKIIEDQFGTIYIGTLGGLEIFNPNTGGFSHFPLEGPEDFRLNNSFVRSLLADKKGNIWIGTEKGGVNHFNLYQKSFYFMTHEVENEVSLSEGAVNSIFRDDDVLWVGTAGGGLNKIGPEDDDFVHFYNDPNDDSSLSSNFVPAIAKDDQGQIWVSTWGAGLNKLLPNGTFKRYGVEAGGHTNAPFNSFVSSLLFDDRGFFLVGTEGGLAVLNTQNERITVLNTGEFGEISEVGCLLKDSQGFYWVGTRRGLYRFPASILKADGIATSRDNDVVKFSTEGVSNDDLETGLSGDYVISLVEDLDGNIWAGTFGDGVSRISFSGKQVVSIENFSTDEGLSNNVVYGILEDQNGRLWMSTDQGLSRFNRDEESFFNFYKDDGLLSNQFYWSAAHKSDDGFLYFGNLKGLNFFNPRSFPDYPFKPKIFITGLRIFNKPVSPGEVRNNEEVLSEHIYLTDTVSLSYKDNVITFEFSALDYFHPQKIKYAYKLEGVDIDWVEVGSDQRIANYTNLGGGTYQFRVKATNSDGEWNSEERIITLVIRPPYWQTTWFKVLLLVAIAALSILYARHHTRRLRVQKRTLENMVHERTRQIEEQNDQLWKQAEALAHTNKVLEKRRNQIEGQKQELEVKNKKILEQRDHLITLNEEVKTVNQSKLRFFTNVSHEFRTPLTLILAPLEKLMEDKTLPGYVHDSLKTVDRNAQRLLMLINQLLSFRKMEAGKSMVRVAKGNIHDFLNDIFHAFDGLAKDHNIDYRSEIKLSEHEVWFDSEKLENILYNLLSNAFKYTPYGGEVVFCATLKVSDGKLKLLIEVGDSGSGISETERNKVFDRFYRVEGVPEDTKGSGIGLALSRELTEAMHGNISVESREEEGTVFKLELPCGKDDFTEEELSSESKPLLSDEIHKKVDVIREELAAPQAEVQEEGEGENSRPAVLVVEDNTELRSLIRQEFENDYDIFEAGNGQKAYEIAKSQRLDLVISDIMMPVMNGIDLCIQIKKNIYTSHIPVVLLSARALIEHQLEGLKTGADDYVAKPFSMKLLRVRAENLITSRRNLKSLFSADNSEEVSVDSVSSLDQQFIEKAYQVLEENYSNAEFSVEKFAEIMFVSRSLLYKKLRALSGMSPNDFITVFRLKKSLSHLKVEGKSVNEVAYTIGFNDPKYFSRVFKKFYKKTPSEYIKEKQTNS